MEYLGIKTRGGGATLEDLVGVADVAGAADVGQGEVELVTIVVTRRTQLVFAVFHTDAAAVPVVGGQNLAVLHAAQVDVDAGRRLGAEPGVGGPAEAEQHAHLLEVRHRRQHSVRIGAGGRVQPGVLHAGVDIALVHIHVDVVGGKAAAAGLGRRGERGGGKGGAEVEVEVPPHVELLRGAHPQPRGDGRDVARAGEKSDAGKVQRGP